MTLNDLIASSDYDRSRAREFVLATWKKCYDRNRERNLSDLTSLLRRGSMQRWNDLFEHVRVVGFNGGSGDSSSRVDRFACTAIFRYLTETVDAEVHDVNRYLRTKHVVCEFLRDLVIPRVRKSIQGVFSAAITSSPVDAENASMLSLLHLTTGLLKRVITPLEMANRVLDNTEVLSDGISARTIDTLNQCVRSSEEYLQLLEEMTGTKEKKEKVEGKGVKEKKKEKSGVKEKKGRTKKDKKKKEAQQDEGQEKKKQDEKEARDENQEEKKQNENQEEKKQDEKEARDEDQEEKKQNENQEEKKQNENQEEKKQDENQEEKKQDENQEEKKQNENQEEKKRDENQEEKKRDENQEEKKQDEKEARDEDQEETQDEKTADLPHDTQKIHEEVIDLTSAPTESVTTVKRGRGRPRKVRTPEELRQMEEKKKRKEEDAKNGIKRGRGRPRKVRTPEELKKLEEEKKRKEEDAKNGIKRGRGRPRKVRTPEEIRLLEEKERKRQEDIKNGVKRGRGRPRKQKAEVVPAQSEATKEAGATEKKPEATEEPANPVAAVPPTQSGAAKEASTSTASETTESSPISRVPPVDLLKEPAGADSLPLLQAGSPSETKQAESLSSGTMQIEKPLTKPVEDTLLQAHEAVPNEVDSIQERESSFLRLLMDDSIDFDSDYTSLFNQTREQTQHND